ncbi:hypothetical protein [Halosimplex sp. TS25]|uniref:hypothetical protein n=1 Tax=Halosimplex rarum TaxID=3396619 RepID=UPI0039ED8476
MTLETRAGSSTVGRRSLLQALAAAGAFGTAATGVTAARGGQDGDDDSNDDADPLYAVEQGDERYEITPLSGSEPVESFYDLRIPEKYVGENGATDPGEGPYYMSVGTRDLQRPSTSLLFFYDGPDGVSLVVVHDADGDDGGSATWTVSGVPASAEWLVKDDFYLFESGERPESNYDNWDTDGSNHRIDWTWGATRGDGGVLGYLDPGASIGINPQFNEEAALYGEHYEGDIDEWQLLSADGEGGVTRSTLDLGAPITVAVERASTDGGGDGTDLDLSVSPPDAKINVESEGLVPVDIDCPDPSAIDLDSISFGAPEAVDGGDGASPKQHDHAEERTCRVHFRVDETDIDPENALAKVVGKIRGSGDGGGGSDEFSSFSLDDAIDAFDPTDDGEDDGDDSDDGEGEEDGQRKDGRGPPDHANDDESNGRGNGNGKGRGNGEGKGN